MPTKREITRISCVMYVGKPGSKSRALESLVRGKGTMFKLTAEHEKDITSVLNCYHCYCLFASICERYTGSLTQLLYRIFRERRPVLFF